jgi:hypothetical protein
VHNAKAKEAKIMSLSSNEGYFPIYIRNSDFICEDTPFVESNVIGDISRIDSRFLYQSAINAKGIKYIEMQSCSFQQCYNALKGGVLQLQDSNLYDTNSVYKCKIYITLTILDNSALRGGVIKASNSKISITGSKFQYNYAFEGGVF